MHAQQAALSRMRDEYGNIAKTLNEQALRGDSEGASWSLDAMADVVNRANLIAGTAGQQQAQPPQGQQQFSPAKAEWIRNNQNVVRDPRKWAECVGAHNAALARGIVEDSPEYFHLIELATGLTGPDGRDGPEIASPETALDAVNNSQIARKFGPVTPDDYNRGVHRLVENKKLGLYEPQQ
jgi:hypothetical protein